MLNHFGCGGSFSPSKLSSIGPVPWLEQRKARMRIYFPVRIHSPLVRVRHPCIKNRRYLAITSFARLLHGWCSLMLICVPRGYYTPLHCSTVPPAMSSYVSYCKPSIGSLISRVYYSEIWNFAARRTNFGRHVGRMFLPLYKTRSPDVPTFVVQASGGTFFHIFREDSLHHKV